METITVGTRRGLQFSLTRAECLACYSSAAGPSTVEQPVNLAGLPEDHAGQADSSDAYGSAKRAAEALTMRWSGAGSSAAVARVFSVYGPYQPLRTHFAIGNFIADALGGRPVIVRGDGAPVRSYLYGADLAVALLACLVRGTPGVAYNVGGTEPIRLRDLAALIASLASPPGEVRVLGRPGTADRYVPDVRRIASDLGFVPAVPLADGVRRTIAWASRRSEGE